MSKDRPLGSELPLGDLSVKPPAVILHRCIRVASLAALLIIVPAGVFAQEAAALDMDVHADGGSVVVH